MEYMYRTEAALTTQLAMQVRAAGKGKVKHKAADMQKGNQVTG